MARKRQHTHFEQLKNKWFLRHKELQKNLWEKHKSSLDWFSKNVSPRQLAAGSLGGLMLLSAPAAAALPLPRPIINSQNQIFQSIDKDIFLISDLFNKLPKEVSPLSSQEEERVTSVLSERFGMKVTAELEGKRLNRNYGLIGQEQHLARYPGDTLASHFDTGNEAVQFSSFGMAPGLGAWGYFAKSKEQMTEKDKLREKYYIAVQTFLSLEFNERVKEYGDFYKFRKMLVVNPQNGKAIVTVIGDAGPAEWTGKHLGGSPEVMNYLEREDGERRGPVLYFFIDDSSDTVPLGPIHVQ